MNEPNPVTGEQVARQRETGCTSVNQRVKFELRVPFGGVNESGHGLELARTGITEFGNSKTAWSE